MKIEQVYKEYFSDVYLYIKAISRSDDIAEEITQDTFFKAIKGIKKFRGDCDIRVWLCQIAKNSYFSYCKKNKILIQDEIDENIVDTTVSIENDYIEQERSNFIKNVIKNMEQPYKSVMQLRIYDELSFKEISQAFHKTESWARVTFHRAKLLIIKEMEKHYGK